MWSSRHNSRLADPSHCLASCPESWSCSWDFTDIRSSSLQMQHLPDSLPCSVYPDVACLHSVKDFNEFGEIKETFKTLLLPSLLVKVEELCKGCFVCLSVTEHDENWKELQFLNILRNICELLLWRVKVKWPNDLICTCQEMIRYLNKIIDTKILYICISDRSVWKYFWML